MLFTYFFLFNGDGSFGMILPRQRMSVMGASSNVSHPFAQDKKMDGDGGKDFRQEMYAEVSVSVSLGTVSERG